MSEFVHALKIQNLLEDSARYIVPMYQRNYAWGEGEISQLIRDVLDYQEKDPKQNYYIGTLVVFERSDGSFEVVDGQQRFTTLSLIANWLRNNKGVLDTDTGMMGWYETLNIDFESRPNSKATFDALWQGVSTDKIQGKEFNAGIVNGYKLVGKVLKREVGDKLAEFCDYLFRFVEISRVKVPSDTDLNHYFEVMNNRGEQLEKHEVVKARLMGVLNKLEDQQDRGASLNALNQIWDACSNMERYVQYGFSIDCRHALFGNEDWGKFEATDFEDIKESLKAAQKKKAAQVSSRLIDIINQPAEVINDKQKKK